MIKVNIDGKDISVNSDKNLLQTARDVGIIIPSLCDPSQPNSKSEENKQDCNLCVVDIKNNDGSCRKAKACQTMVTDNMKVTTQTAELSELRRKALTHILSDHFADCEAPCQQACPAGVDIQSYLFHIAQGNHTEAVRVIKQTLPLPLSIGRVCPAFCEAECRRGLIDEPLAIRQLKRHAADLDLADEHSYQIERQPDTGKKVAIIGSGPAGLSAGYFLSNQGHDVTIIESMPQAGGWLRYGIPEYRLPKDILDKEIDLLTQNGLKINTGIRLGEDTHLNELTEQYDAVCLAIGAQKAVPMNYPGSDLAGCYLGVDYLRDYCTDKTFSIGKKVAVIGGGNTAIDCARTAVRAGHDVTLIYRRTRDDMPAEPYEVHEAEVEGVKFHFLTNPVENISDDNGQVIAVNLAKMALGEPDSSGRRSPKATGETFTEAFDTVIAAVSQTPDMSFLEHPGSSLTSGEIALSRWNTFIGCEHTMSAGVDKLFVIGDSRRGPATAVAAIGDGRKAAIAIDGLLTQGLSCDLTPQEFNATKAPKTASLSAQLYPSIKAESRYKMAELSAIERQLNFNEVELGFTQTQAMKEAARCLECACQANTDCKLRDYATEYRIDPKTLDTTKMRQFEVDKTSPFIQFDANRCISCGKCVDICGQQSGHNAIKFEKDSYQALPVSVDNSPLQERNAPRAGFKVSMADSDCVQCGNCVQVCPTGALVDARDKRQGETETLITKSTICTYCGVGCRLNVSVSPSTGKICHVEGSIDSDVNEGMLCVKGRFGFDFLQSEERLTTPLIRKEGELVPCSWDEALDTIAEKLTAIKAKKGGDAIATLASAKATNEDNYLIQRFVRTVLGTNNIDHCARLCHSSTVSALQQSIGSGAMTGDIPGIKESDLIFILGSDTCNAHPIIASKIKQALRHHGARLLVADPKRVSIADEAQLYVAQKPGSDVSLINAIMGEIIRNNWHDVDYINKHTQGFDAVMDAVLQPEYTPEIAAKVTGVSAQNIIKMAHMIGTAKKTAIYYAMGITQHTSGHDNVTAISNLQLLCGNIGQPGAGINPLRGQSNVQGACDMGSLPQYYTGYQKVDNPAVQAKFEQHWNTSLSPNIGLTATEVMHAITHEDVDALYVMGENPVLSDPDQAHVLEALEKIPFLVVQDIFLTETAKFADIVLPAAAFAEKTGHFTNTERRVQRLEPILPPPGQARQDWKIIHEIANRMGANWHYENEKAITNEINQVTPQYQGISWDRLNSDEHGKPSKGIQWPCPSEDHLGTPVLHKNQPIIGKGVFTPVTYRSPAETTDEQYPLVLSTGRLLEQFHTGTLSRKTQGLDTLGSPRVMISVFDAEQLGVNNGDMLKLSTRRGELEIAAFVTKRAQAGVLFLPFHFVEAAANKLTINAIDPVSKIPEFKVCAVKAEKVVAVVA
ncbi:formate dehydrogenase subunit alpha [Shewanella intestini]|uniref:Formate dehydrogenase subunit alpha n=1 Tax=Shewanella intestini TaxID=2017544 RepID=A0ABS5I632_9GAMM|nr:MULTISPECIES: formate dehydrogenase subunit alpha [Shewanella]MBR9729179.1 formate dehydrogenase subunit alpha [Shewanella intestini]MRG37250.1 formate dehydrogenase subunit alpha [Shewanella sp. XMDDZSB0408]